MPSFSSRTPSSTSTSSAASTSFLVDAKLAAQRDLLAHRIVPAASRKPLADPASVQLESRRHMSRAVLGALGLRP